MSVLGSENILCMKEYEIMPNDRATSISNRNFNGARRGGGNNNIGIQSNTANRGAMKGSTVRALNRDGGRQEEKKDTKLYISNLDKNVSVGNIRELFGRFGHLGARRFITTRMGALRALQRLTMASERRR